MLNVAAKVSEATNDLLDGAARASGRNGDPGNARSQTVSVLGGGMKVTGDVTGEGSSASRAAWRDPSRPLVA